MGWTGPNADIFNAMWENGWRPTSESSKEATVLRTCSPSAEAEAGGPLGFTCQPAWRKWQNPGQGESPHWRCPSSFNMSVFPYVPRAPTGNNQMSIDVVKDLEQGLAASRQWISWSRFSGTRSTLSSASPTTHCQRTHEQINMFVKKQLLFHSDLQ